MTQPFQANTTTANTQAYGQVAAQSTGAYAAVWSDFSTGSARLVGRRFDAQGHPLTSEVTLASLAGLTSDAIAITPDNAVHVVATANGGLDVYKLDPTSLAVGSIYPFGSSGTYATSPAITSFADGSVFFTYTNQQNGSKSNIFGAPISANGSLGAFVQITNNSSITDDSKITTLSNGNVVIVYDATLTNGDDYDALFQIRTGTGGAVKGQTELAGSGTTAYEGSPDVAALSNGGFAAVFTKEINGSYEIVGDVYDSQGNVTRTAFTVNTTTTGDQYSPAVSALPNGGFVVTWQDSQTSTQRAQVFDANGNKIGGEIKTLSSSANFTDSATLSTGQTVLSFDSSAGGDYNIVNGILDTRSNTANSITGHNFFGTSTADTLIIRNQSTPTNVSQSGGTLTLYGLASNGSATQIGQVGADFVFDASGDINGDGRSDLFGHNDVGAVRNIYAFTSGPTKIASSKLLEATTTTTQIVGSGDFNHDGVDDLLLQRDNGGNRTLSVLPVVNGAGGTEIQTAVAPTSWSVDAIGNFTSDQHSDSILMHYDDGAGRHLELLNVVNGVTSSITNLGVVGNNYQVLGAADFNGDGTQDLLLENDTGSTRNLTVAEVHSNAITAFHTIGAVGNNIQIDGLGDYNGDGVADLGYHFDSANNTRTTGALLLSNYQIAGNQTLGVTGNEWEAA